MINHVFGITGAVRALIPDKRDSTTMIAFCCSTLRIQTGESDISKNSNQRNPFSFYMILKASNRRCHQLWDCPSIYPGTITKGTPQGRIHGLWCVHFSYVPLEFYLPLSGSAQRHDGRGTSIRAGDEKLLQFAHDIQSASPTSPFIDICDRLMIVNQFPLWLYSLSTTAGKDEGGWVARGGRKYRPSPLEDQSKEEARKAFEVLWSLSSHNGSPQDPTARLCQSFGISYNCSFCLVWPLASSPGYKEDVSALVEITQDSVREWVKDDGPW